MATNKITAEVRETSGKGVARRLRTAGRIPAVLYGQGHDGVSLTLDSHELNLLLATTGAKTSVLELEVLDGGKGPRRNVLIKEVQTHPYKDEILHMDLLEIAMDELISVMVPLEITGIPKGVRIDDGILEMKRRELEIECLPHIIPDSLVIDVTDLEIGDNIHVEDIKVPEGVTIPHDVNFTLMTVVAPAVEVEEEVELEEGEEGEEGEGEAADTDSEEEETEEE